MPITAEGHRRLLIEEWLPIRELGIESVRERQAPSALPPLSFLHVWWARRPLAAAQGVQIAALLPTWREALMRDVSGLEAALRRVRSYRKDIVDKGSAPRDAAGKPRRLRPDKKLAEEMTNEDWYHIWVLWVSGVWGDAVLAETVKNEANVRGIRLGKNPFTWNQAYRNKPDADELKVLHQLLELQWGRLPFVVDPTAGGGSIPFTAQRYGLPTHGNDLNPVAASVLDASLRTPAKYGLDLAGDLEKWGQQLVDAVTDRLAPFFVLDDPEETVVAYLWVNCVTCPRTGGSVPLAPNWWLDKKGKGTAVQPLPVWGSDDTPSHIEYRIVSDIEGDGVDPNRGTVARGQGVSLWDGLVVDGDYIKSEAASSRLRPELYAVACSKPKKSGRGKRRYYRAPTETDRRVVRTAAEELEQLSTTWRAADVLPVEVIPPGSKTSEPRRFGMETWRDMFTERQLLVHGTLVEEWRRLVPELRSSLGTERGDAVASMLATALQNKALNYNSRLSNWHPTRGSMANVFDRHDFAFSWTHGEFHSKSLMQWSLDQLMYAYRGKTKFEGLARLLQPHESARELTEMELPTVASISSRPGSNLALDDNSVECVNIDPPYYDNVQYAELADFFYVWEKRTLGQLHPERFQEELTDKDNEAVANPARFVEAGRRKRELASFDYQQKMQAIFVEAKRVLTDDGVLVVWFTHKAADAWDVLGTAMIDAGFTIETSWPINTESAISLHQAKVNSAASTIILVCRKRRVDSDGVFFEEIEADVRRAAVEAVADFSDTVGATGVDLQLSTYGPTLSVISSHWPVLSDEAGEDGRARRLRPEEALAVAREEVNRLVKSRLVGHAAQFDDATDFWLLCWANFQAREFPYDEARKLGMSTLDVDGAVQAGLVKKKAGKVELVKPTSRGRSLRSKMADSGRFPTLVDALHHLLNSYRDDGLASTRTWLADSGYGGERSFLDTLQAAVNAIPRVRTKKGLSVPEAQELEDVVVALFGDKIEVPAEVEELIEAQQTSLEV